MIAVPDGVIEKALSLSADIRINLVEKLITSLKRPINGYQSSLDKRGGVLHIQIGAGEVRLIHGEEVFFDIRAKCGK